MLSRLLFLLSVLLLSGCSLTASAPSAVLPTSPPVFPATATSAPPTTTSPSAPAVPPTATPAPPTAASTSTPTAIPSATSAPPTATPRPPAAEVVYSYPMALPDRPPGDGFVMRHGYATENTWFNPNHWHAGEDWYLQEGDIADAPVYAIAAGEVVYVGSNYPGRVVIVAHPDGLFSMYGHLDPAVAVQTGQQVARGALLGTILRRSDSVPNHLHFEVRTFYTTTEVNGANPRYPFACGVNCPPGPGYWPIADPQHPSDMGWRNPTHVINNRALAPADGPRFSEVVVPAQPAAANLTVWSAPPPSDPAAVAVGELELQPGARFTRLATWTGPEDTRATSATSYQVWYQLAYGDDQTGWVAALGTSSRDTGSDGRPSGVVFNLLPALP